MLSYLQSLDFPQSSFWYSILKAFQQYFFQGYYCTTSLMSAFHDNAMCAFTDSTQNRVIFHVVKVLNKYQTTHKTYSQSHNLLISRTIPAFKSTIQSYQTQIFRRFAPFSLFCNKKLQIAHSSL